MLPRVARALRSWDEFRLGQVAGRYGDSNEVNLRRQRLAFGPVIPCFSTFPFLKVGFVVWLLPIGAQLS